MLGRPSQDQVVQEVLGQYVPSTGETLKPVRELRDEIAKRLGLYGQTGGDKRVFKILAEAGLKRRAEDGEECYIIPAPAV